MSVYVLTWAFQQKTEQPVDKLVLLSLADWASDDGECFPSRPQIAERALCSLDTVDRSIKRLIEAGLMEKIAQAHQAGGPAANRYRLAVVAGGSRNLRPGSADAARGVAASDAARVAAPACGQGSRNGAATGTVKGTVKGTFTAPTRQSGREFWSKALNPDADELASFDGETITLSESERKAWLAKFKTEERLQAALTQAAGYVQPNSNRAMIVQVRSQLAKQHGDMIDRDRRYAKSSGTAQPDTSDALRQIAAITGKRLEVRA